MANKHSMMGLHIYTTLPDHRSIDEREASTIHHPENCHDLILSAFPSSSVFTPMARKPRSAASGVSPHTLRHTFAVEYLRGGADTFTLQRILGHSTLEMTRHYAEVSDGDVEIKQKAFSPAERLGMRV